MPSRGIYTYTYTYITHIQDVYYILIYRCCCGLSRRPRGLRGPCRYCYCYCIIFYRISVNTFLFIISYVSLNSKLGTSALSSARRRSQRSSDRRIPLPLLLLILIIIIILLLLILLLLLIIMIIIMMIMIMITIIVILLMIMITSDPAPSPADRESSGAI